MWFIRSDDLLVLTDTVRIGRVNWKILARILEVFLNREGYFNFIFLGAFL